MSSLTARRAAWIAVAAVAVFGLRVVVGGTGDVGVAFLFVVPVGMAGWWFGRGAGLGVAAACIGLYVIAVTLRPVAHPVAAGSVRAAVLVVGALVAAELRARSERLALTSAELDVVRQALTPASLPRLPGLDVALSFMPATHGVSGDFYLLTNGPDGINIAIVGDVSGHGPRAARTATFARATLASMAANSSDPAEILHLVNQALVGRWSDEEYLTATCVAHDPRTHRVRWATAGHPYPIRLSDLDPLAAGSALPIGIDHRARFRAADAPLPPPDGLLLYTDGLLDARRDRERFGEQRLLRALAGCATSPARDVAETLRRSVSGFAANRFADDICILVLRATASV